MEYNKSGSQKRATVVGPLAEKISKLKLGETMSCLMVKDGDTYKIMAPEDLPICTRTVTQHMLIPYSGPFFVLGDRLKDLRWSVVYQIDEDSVLRALKVRDCVTIKYESEKHISLNWDAGQISDRVANSILSNLVSLNREKLNMNYVSDSLSWEVRKQKKKDKAIHDILLSLFGDVKLEEDEKFVIMVENNVAYIDKESGDVESENEGLKERLTKLYKHIRNRVALSNNSDQCLNNSPWIPPTIFDDDSATLRMQAEIAPSREDRGAFRQDSSQGARTRTSGSGGNIRTKKIFIGGLPPTLTDEEFRQYFENFGQVTAADIMYDQSTQHLRGFGFISFDTEDAADRVLQKNFHDLNGKVVEVKRAVPKNANSGSCNRRGYQNYASSRGNSSSYEYRMDGNRYMQPQSASFLSYPGYNAAGYGGGYGTSTGSYGGYGGYGCASGGAAGASGGYGGGLASTMKAAWSNQTAYYGSSGYGADYGPTAGYGSGASAQTGQARGGGPGYGNQAFGDGYGASGYVSIGGR